jgi:hypothetical protein
VLIVISIAKTPPVKSALANGRTCSGLGARTTAITPGSVSSEIIWVLVRMIFSFRRALAERLGKSAAPGQFISSPSAGKLIPCNLPGGSGSMQETRGEMRKMREEQRGG